MGVIFSKFERNDEDKDISLGASGINGGGQVLISTPFSSVEEKLQSVCTGETSKSNITLQDTTCEPVQLLRASMFEFDSQPANSFTSSLLELPSINNTKGTGGFLEQYAIRNSIQKPHEADAGNGRIEPYAFPMAEDRRLWSMASNRPHSRLPRRTPAGFDKSAVSLSSLKGSQGSRYKPTPFAIPNDVRELLEDKQVPDVLMEGLTKQNYVSFFRTLLIMEDIHLEKKGSYHMKRVIMRRAGDSIMVLLVPGLAESMPSIAPGFSAFVKLSLCADDNTGFEGYVERVVADQVLLKFPKRFYRFHRNGNLYDVSFTYNRETIKRLYKAVERARTLDADLLFPRTSRRRLTESLFVPVTCNLNEEQKQSVGMILSCNGGSPYLIYGPPGTGKTMTLVEAILQIYMTRQNARILVCTASNSAADHILEKLFCSEVAEVRENEVLRLNASSRAYEDVQKNHIRFCYSEDFIFKCPPFSILRRYRIIISTYMSASRLCKERIRRGHFSHIFLDEAGQVSEPESMIPLASFCKKGTVTVLAGDPKQLGPVIHSKDAEGRGLGKSFLERLCECAHYKNMDENYVTMLVKNYRCHPAILGLPSKLFYDGELLACKTDTSVYSLEHPSNNSFPVIFTGIQGHSEREGNNPSWFNQIEVETVVEVIQKLRAKTDLNEADIGVIAPYRKQVLKIKSSLEKLQWPDVKVGSVEQFQGQEKEVIIVSTVRSMVAHKNFDRTYSLGFLTNPRRFNVAITRAKSLLVIIGDPYVICKDFYWKKLLRYCYENDSYQGCPIPESLVNAESSYIAGQEIQRLGY